LPNGIRLQPEEEFFSVRRIFSSAMRRISMKKFWGAVFLLAVCLALAGTAGAQTQITMGVIQGTVKDPSGAVVPGAGVEVKNLDTNYTRKLTTDADGRFVALLLPPGRYTVTVTKEGFAKLVQENVDLTVGATIALPVTMKVSAVAETVTVTATPTIETTVTEASSTLNERTVRETPVVGRKFEDLLTLTPGVSIVQGPDGDEINFNGQRGIFNNISLDGGDYINGFFGEQAGGQRADIDITLDAVKEFQVVIAGGLAEYGRTASGIVNVVTKSGTNEFHGDLFHFQRHRNLSSDDSLGRPLTDFHREQSGGSLSGPIVRNKAFWLVAVEQIGANLQRPGLSAQTGSIPCPAPLNTAAAWTRIVSGPGATSAMTGIPAETAQLNANPDCQRLALLAFMQATRSQNEGLPIRHPEHNTNVLSKFDWTVTPRNQFSVSYNFDRSRNVNQTFDVDGYGNSANGIEGTPSIIHVVNVNLVSNISPTILNEGHFTYNREKRPRAATPSNDPSDTAMGFVNTFRFGNPFFLNPNINELFYRTQLRDNISIVAGKHTIKFGAEWIHSLNNQVFRGFFTGRYIFDSVVGFLRYASPQTPAVAGFGPTVAECADGTFTDHSLLVADMKGALHCTSATGPLLTGPLLLYLQDGTPTGVENIPPGASKIINQEYGAFVQDKWQMARNFTLNYGLRWEGQVFPNPVFPPIQTAYGPFLSDPRFPSDGTLHSQKKEFQPRIGFAWDVANNQKSVLRASYGIYNARQNMLTQVGSITTNGAQQFGQTCASTFAFTCFGAAPPTAPRPPTWPGPLPPPSFSGIQSGSGVRVFSKDYANPRIYNTNVAFEQEIARDWALYVDFTHSKGVHLTRFFNVNANGAPGIPAPMNFKNTFASLGDVFVAEALGKSLYRGFTIGMRKRFSHRFQMEGNYVYSRDYDDDANERDPFTDRRYCTVGVASSAPAAVAAAFGVTCDKYDLHNDYARSDRDRRHKFNYYLSANLPWKFEANIRMQAGSAQPVTPLSATLLIGPRNTIRKSNDFFVFNWRLARPISFGERVKLIPILEMFNTFNNDNNIDPLTFPGEPPGSKPPFVPSLFNFDGFLRSGVGDPRQLQLALKLTW
jgi:hypothetical protein